MKAFKKCFTLIASDRRVIHAIKEIEPLDRKSMDDELLLSGGLCRFS